MMRVWAILLLVGLAGCDQKPDDSWLGYGEGDYAFIAAPEAGWVTRMAVERGASVHPGEPLFILDDTRQQSSRDQAQASLAAARAALGQEKANFAYARTELTRQDNLAAQGVGTPTQRDLARNTFHQSAARIAQLEAQIAQTQASLAGAAYGLAQREVVSRTDGVVQDIYFRPGEYVPAATPVLSVLPPANVYVRFFVPETEIARVRLGQKVRVTCDGCKPMIATVSFIANREEFTPPVIFSIGNREKLVYKLEARMAGGMPIHAGQPVNVRPL